MSDSPAHLAFDALNAALKAAGEETRLRILALVGEAERLAHHHGCDEIRVTRPGEWRLWEAFTARQAGPLPWRLLEDSRFYTTPDDFAAWMRGRKQPRLEPGESFEYTSWAMLKAPYGTMSGEYVMQRDDQSRFEARISEFALTRPHELH